MMTRTLLAGLFGLLLSIPALAWADTCTTTSGSPSYGNNVPVPITCDTDGRQQMKLMNPDGSPVTFGGSTVAPFTDVTVTASATLVRVASASRVALSCTNTDGAVHVRWGDSAVTATKGQRIAAGASIEIKSLGAVYMFSEGTDVTMSCTEELR